MNWQDSAPAVELHAPRRRRIRTCLPIVVALIMAAGMWSFFDHVLIPLQEAEAALKNLPRGNASDLYPPWLGARELLLHRRDPYSAEVNVDIQRGFWGRSIDRHNPNDPPEAIFAHPLYVVFVLAPTVSLPFDSVRILYIAVAVALSVTSVWCWLRLYGEAGSVVRIAVASILFLGSYPFVQALHSQQLTLLVAALVAGSMAAIAGGALWVAGIMLALATIKPHMIAAVAGWLLLWAASGWRERKALCISFAVTMTVLFIGAELLLPGWIWKWRELVSVYLRYEPLPRVQVQVMFGNNFGTAVGVALSLALGVFCWRTRFDSASTDRFKLVPALILTTYLLVSPVWHNYDHVLLLPAALLGFHWRDRFHELKPFEGAVVGLSAVALAWQWIAALVVSVTMFVSPALAQREQILPWLSILLVPASALISLFLLARVRLRRI